MGWPKQNAAKKFNAMRCSKGVESEGAEDQKPEAFKCSGVGNHGRATSILSSYRSPK